MSREPYPEFKLKELERKQEEQYSFSQKAADEVAKRMGSWHFLFGQTCVVIFWVSLNLFGFIHHWDPYPFILLNLLFSVQASYAAPVIMMSQNRQEEKDRSLAKHIFLATMTEEQQNRHIMGHLDHQDEMIFELLQHINENFERVEKALLQTRKMRGGT